MDPRVCQHFLTESTIDKGPYLNMMDDGMVNAMCDEGTQIDKTEDTSEDLLTHDEKTEITTVVVESEEQKMEENPSCTNEAIPYLKFEQRNQIVNDVKDITAPVNKRMKQLFKQNKTSMWFLIKPMEGLLLSGPPRPKNEPSVVRQDGPMGDCRGSDQIGMTRR
ncbi:hypothetical protein QJS04_geneDACA011507 [Acorus gramineus]|uniref:Uncharacterized protein n=1 Tax=Acorus gramineus TaxID=55184 RepID=A0AAV9A2U0_ACOGR|nr:hypothetical protein QJS04_geneDACA011507 [Acorus gramineus]